MGNTTSSPKITAQDRAILQVKLQKDKLIKYQRSSQILLKNEEIQIKSYLKQGNKTSAKLLLKRSKYQKQLLENVSDQLMNLENMISNIEFKLVEKEFLKGLTNGNEILKKLNGEMKVEDVEKLVDEVQENIAYQEEIDQVLSNSLIGKDIDDEIDEELKALEEQEQQRNKETIPNLPTVQGLPKIKDATKREEKKEEEKKAENNPEKNENKEKRTALLA